MREKGESVFRDNYKGHMDKTKGRWNEGGRWGWLGLGGVVGGKAENYI